MMLKVPTNQVVKLQQLDIAHNKTKQTSRHLERWHYVLNCVTPPQTNILKPQTPIWLFGDEGLREELSLNQVLRVGP